MERDSPRRPAWWMHVMATSYVVTFGFILYLIVRGPAQLDGFSTSFAGGTMTVQTVTRDSPEWHGGLRAGDRIVSIDDRPIHGVSDWVAATANFQLDEPQRWLVARGEEHVPLEIQLSESSLRSRVAEGYVVYTVLLVTALGLGLLIAWKRPGDVAGRLGAWFMMTASIAFGFPWGWAVVWRALPEPAQLLLWIPQISRFVLEGIFVSFFLVFPRRSVSRSWLWFLVWVPVLASLPWRVQSFYGVIHPGRVEPIPAWILQAGFVRTIVYLVAGVGILVVSYRHLLDPNEKRRVRVLMAGTAASALAAMSLVWIDSFLGRAHLRESSLEILLFFVIVPFTAACPLSLAYAILRHRVLGISIIIRQGLQYVLARGAIIGLVPALGGVLVVDLILNRDQPLADIFRRRGWVYTAAAGLSLLAYWNRRKWLDAIDRRFFRERYDAQRLLREVLEEVRSAREFESVAPRVAERLERAFHPELVAVMVRRPDEPEYRPIVSVPGGPALPSLSAETKLAGLLRVLGKPLEVTHAGAAWLDQRLPREEIELLRQARIDLLVPIVTTAGGEEALLALGMKRSEEPYTREDQEFLEGIAASMALLIERTVPEEERPTLTSQAFRECPECGLCYESTSKTCREDGAGLMALAGPRTLAGRYRLERRRGHGGMGTVYQATDGELGRQVAIKLVREDWSNRADALQRFRREARAAATFAHPNVVTVHDYGIEADSRAFLVMELLQGVTLQDEIRRRGQLAPSRVVEILRGVCAAVEAAHRHHLIHRDLKPANIFLARSPEGSGEVVKVLDFGIAKFLASEDDSVPTQTRGETHAGALVGTPAYMSPERLLGKELDALSDLWALGVVAYEALTGALPFALAESDWQRAIIAGEYTPLSAHWTSPPASLEKLFARCFSTDRGKRPQSAAEFFSELEHALTAG